MSALTEWTPFHPWTLIPQSHSTSSSPWHFSQPTRLAVDSSVHYLMAWTHLFLMVDTMMTFQGAIVGPLKKMELTDKTA